MCKSLKEGEVDLSALLPKEINEWKALEEDKIFDPETIFDYIDGAGEVYRSYNFKSLLARHFTKEGKPDIHADLFDMGSSKEAFGVFTHDLEGEDVGIGQGSTYNGGLLSFWKGRFFVSLFAEEETEDAKDALLALGRMVDSAIKKTGEKPQIVSFFPQENLLDKRVHYLHNHMILNYHFYVADENILLLDQQTDAALAVYREGDEAYYALLVNYSNPEKASVAYKSFINTYMPDARESGLVQTEDMKWTAAEVKDNLLIIVFNAASDLQAKETIKRIENRTERK